MKLLPHQVPDPPDAMNDGDHLRWMTMVMDEDDSSLPFIVSVYAYWLKNGYITRKQFRAASKIQHRIYEAWAADELECCMHDDESESNLAHMEVGGSA